MPAVYTCRAWRNTGYNRGNWPDGPEQLANFQDFTDFDAVFEWQSQNLTTIKLKTEWDTVKDIDYLRLQNGTDTAYYVVNAVAMSSPQTAVLNITMDPLTTAGGVKVLTAKTGHTERAHVQNDGLFSNILPEAWAPSNPLKLLDAQIIHDEESPDIIVIGSTCSADDAGYQAAALYQVLSNPDYTMTIPQLPPVDPGQFTEFSMLGHSYTQPGIVYYVLSIGGLTREATARAITQLRQGGIESAVTASYVLKQADVDLTESDPTRAPYRATVYTPDGSITAETGEVFKWTAARESFFGGKKDPIPTGSTYVAGAEKISRPGMSNISVPRYLNTNPPLTGLNQNHTTITGTLTKADGTVVNLPEGSYIYYFENATGATRRIITLAGKSQQYAVTSPYTYGTVKNKKALALYNAYNLVSLSSGSSAEFEAAELYSGGTSPDILVIIDPSPTGTAYARPTYYEGRQLQNLEHAVAGLDWLNSGLVYSGASGSTLNSINAARQNKRISFNQNIAQRAFDRQTEMAEFNLGWSRAHAALGIPGALSGAAAGNPAALGSAISGGFGAVQAEAMFGFMQQQRREARADTIAADRYNMGDNLFTAQLQNAVVAPVVAFPASVNNAAYFGNSFCVYHVGLSDNDLKRFDDYLSAYGYSQDKTFEITDLTNRKHHNYIKASDCTFTAPGVSQSLLRQIADMFAAGGRVWHVPPTREALLNNPVKEA